MPHAAISVAVWLHAAQQEEKRARWDWEFVVTDLPSGPTQAMSDKRYYVNYVAILIAGASF